MSVFLLFNMLSFNNVQNRLKHNNAIVDTSTSNKKTNITKYNILITVYSTYIIWGTQHCHDISENIYFCSFYILLYCINTSARASTTIIQSV